jgi:hypothetical protein
MSLSPQLGLTDGATPHITQPHIRSSIFHYSLSTLTNTACRTPIIIMCIEHYDEHSCGCTGEYLGITICLSRQDTKALLKCGIPPTHGRIRSNAFLCQRESTIDRKLVDTKCASCRRKDEEELAKMGFSYVKRGPDTA